MAARPCHIALTGCPGVDSPITNISAEAPDPLLFWGVPWNPYNPYKPPPLGNGQYVIGDCPGWFTSLIAQFDPVIYAQTQLWANLQALALQLGCDIPQVGDLTFQNDAQTATVYCPDGSAFSYTVDAGTITATFADAELGAAWVLAANAWALAYAYEQASALLQCGVGDPEIPRIPGDNPPDFPRGPGILNNPAWMCFGENYVDNYTITGGSIITNYTMSVIAGAIPPGTVFTQTGPRTAKISGVVTAPGQYTWTIQAVSTGIPTVTVTFQDSLWVMGISNASSLDGAEVGVPYSDTLEGIGGTSPYTFALDSGSTLPDTFILDANGTLHSPGPTEDGDFTFDVIITDARGGECTDTISITVIGGLNPSLWWTMEVGGPIPPILDVIQSVPLNHFTGTTADYTKETGIVGQSWQLKATGLVGAPAAIVITDPSSFLRFTDEGITIAWWQYRSGNNLPALGTPSIVYKFFIDATNITLDVSQFGLRTAVFFKGPEVITGPALSLNTWHFCAIRIDNSDNTLTLDIDQTTQLSVAIAPLGTGVYADGTFSLLTDIASIGGGFFITSRYDEVAFFQSVLSDSDLDSLWNGGIGRTWP